MRGGRHTEATLVNYRRVRKRVWRKIRKEKKKLRKKTAGKIREQGGMSCK